MQKLVGLAVMIVFFSFASIAEAERLDIETLTTIGGDLEFIPDSSFHSSITLFQIPTKNFEAAFSYFGLNQRISDWWQLGIFFGGTVNFPIDGVNGFDISVWNNLKLFEGVFSVFIETDFIFSPNGYDYYGFYALNLNREWMSAGVHLEQVNSRAISGPQIGFSIGIWRGEIQYHINTQDLSHAIRIVNTLNF